ncbi:MAG TPA: 4Fe-4S cluster-binding domain-containing protein [Nitrolancea sp.]|nr:4Fe-4S cluster-binding domain-containing protein [Nitrolancea sp.]
MNELTWLLDPATGGLVAEGITVAEASALAGDLLPPPREVTCARPLSSPPLPVASTTASLSLRIARIYHGSLIEGPGRRSVVQLQGCPIRCPGCAVPETHDPAGGTELSVVDVVAALLDPVGEPRDGISVLGGEPVRRIVGA